MFTLVRVIPLFRYGPGNVMLSFDGLSLLLMKILTPSILFLFVLPLCSAQQRFYVHAGASGNANGSSWHHAFTNLDAALDQAGAGDTVWVAGGLYLPSKGVGRNAAFTPKSGVKLYGGFGGTEQKLSERNISQHETRLSGNIGNPLDSTDNAYTVMYLTYPDSNTVLDGMVFEHGYANSDTSFDNSSPVRAGGGVYILASRGVAMPVFRHCIFRHNVAAGLGGAVCVWADQAQASIPLFQYCTFYNNLCGYYGGAVYLSGGTPVDRGVEFDHCIFRDNKSYRAAGGVFIDKSTGSDVTDFLACTVSGHYADRWAGFLYYQLTAAVPLRGIRIDSCDFSNNYCKGTGIGNDLVGGDVLGHVFGEVRNIFEIKNSIIHHHIAPYNPQAALCYFGDRYNTRDTAWFVNNIVRDNKNGGGIGGANGYVVIRGNTFYNNRRPNQGFSGAAVGGSSNCDISYNLYANNELVFTGVPSRSEPGTLYHIHHNLLVNNTIPDSTGYHTASIIFPSYSFISNTGRYAVTNNFFLGNRIFKKDLNPEIFYANGRCENNIFWGNRNSIDGSLIIPLSVGYDSLYLAYNLSDVDCGALGKRVTCGPGNIAGQAPVFVNYRTGDYRLSPCSPGVDAGNNSAVEGIGVDFNGKVRIAGARVDIGPFESPWPLTKPRLRLVGDTLSCPGFDTGMLTALVDSATAPLRYRWNTGATIVGLTNLSPGTYRLTVTDAANCVDSTAVAIREAPVLQLSPVIQNATGAGKSDGSIELRITSGIGPFKYHWNTTDTSARLTQLLPGLYTVTIVDAADCGYVYAYQVEVTSAAASGAFSGQPAFMAPNPAVSQLELDWGDQVEWRLFSPQGQLLLRENRPSGPSRSSVSVDTLPAGAYPCVWADKHGRFTRTCLIIQ